MKSKKVLNQKDFYTISDYKEGIHKLNDMIKVFTKSGNVKKIYKRLNNVNEPYFYVTDELFFRNKKDVINWINK